MPSRVEVDEIHEKTADSGVTIKDDLKLSSGNAIKQADGTSLLTEAGALGSSVVFPAGHVIKTYWQPKLGVQEILASQTRVAITDLAIAGIIPKNDSSKFLVRLDASFWGNDSSFNLERSIASGSYEMISPPTDVPGSVTSAHFGGSHRGIYESNSGSMTILDSPATASTVNYKVTFNIGGDGNGYINRPSTFGTAGSDEQLISALTIQEIAG